MSNTVPRQQSPLEAARSDAPAVLRTDTPLPEFQASSPIELEIARSERASAALAASRALMRAAFTDSQLAASEASGESDSAIGDWVSTEYAALDHLVAARSPTPDPMRAAQAAAAASRNMVAGTFDPGIVSRHGRTFLGGSSVNSPIKTHTGNHARFLQESRLTPRGASVAGSATKIELSLAAGPTHYDKPAVLPMLATPGAAPTARQPASPPAAAIALARAAPGESLKFVLAAGFGAAIAVMGAGVAWRAGWLSHTSPNNASLITARVAAQAEAARLLAASPRAIDMVAPAAGVTASRSNEEVDAALAAAARAAAVPVASVHAAGPSRVARSLPPEAGSVALEATAPRRPQGLAKDSVAAAIANAQSRADDFLSAGTGNSPATTAPPSALKHEQ